ncbi:MAG TPA: Fic family protein, partial [Tepidisphaeraceae bacterium]|nr:Fic family protein [Tepidisphaeraceae bacterium]
MQIEFLSVAEILELHETLIREFGGSVELRDPGLLESALAMPQSQFGGEFLHPDLAAMAAAYLYHLVMNHPFVDGNKRTGSSRGARVPIDETMLHLIQRKKSTATSCWLLRAANSLRTRALISFARTFVDISLQIHRHNDIQKIRPALKKPRAIRRRQF